MCSPIPNIRRISEAAIHCFHMKYVYVVGILLRRMFYINLFSNPPIFLTYSVFGEWDREMSSDHIYQEVF